MKPKVQTEQPQLFQSRLDQILNMKHPLCILASQINWSYFEQTFGVYYSEERGAPGKPIRLVVGLHYLKHAYNESDESVVERFMENPYWQYFCGYEYFQHHLPIDPSSLSRWRGRVGAKGIEKLLKQLLQTAQRSGHLKRSDLNQVNVDTTVQEKAIAYPTDARLYYKMREALVRAAKANGIGLRQSYCRKAKKALRKQGRYAHAKQMKRSSRMTRQLKTYLGRVCRDIQRKCVAPDEGLVYLLQLAEKLLAQEKDSKNKLYSIHAPEVECISKGKVHKRYEFGCKVGLVTSSRGNWILGVNAFHGNPYDGHTLASSLAQVEELTGWKVKCANVDLGYRGYNYEGETEIRIADYHRIKKLTRWARKWVKRRAAIEPVIGHAKSDHRMDRNYLKGEQGDKINALLSGCGFNFRKLLKAFFLPIFEALYYGIWEIIERYQNHTPCKIYLGSAKYSAPSF
jgi:IS5 family transposase